MNIGMFEITTIILSIIVLMGIKLMSSPKTAVRGNQLGAISMILSIVLVLLYNKIVDVKILWVAMMVGGIIGFLLAKKVTMIQMPQMVALLNGSGGAASALVALVVIFETYTQMNGFNRFTSQLALIVGSVTLSGSLIAAGKLDRRITQKPVILNGHNIITYAALIMMACFLIVGSIATYTTVIIVTLVSFVVALAFGVLFAIRVGGADMPITISLLNSFSGLAASICGLSIGDPLLVSVGAIVGASGIILTGIMCKAMNRSFIEVLSGNIVTENNESNSVETDENSEQKEVMDIPEVFRKAKRVIIAPGYGMALAQAQHHVKRLMDTLESQGKEVQFAIHPVAGRMPGHMNVLLAEVDIPYDKLHEMDEINPEFKDSDVVIVIGACDVVNPAAITAEGTPIYGMPILRVDEAKHIIVCNMDTEPGYSGVPNPLYNQQNVHLMLGNAAETLDELIDLIK
jgi:NAD(P) transhydrogenase subunit beta